jgi:hypothetical protein
LGNADDHPQTAYKEKAMTYENEAKAWIQSSPYADVPVGRFTLRFGFSADRDWGWRWDCKHWLMPEEYRGSPEHNYLDRIFDGLEASMNDLSFIDELLEAMQKKPFNQGENYEI